MEKKRRVSPGRRITPEVRQAKRRPQTMARLRDQMRQACVIDAKTGGHAFATVVTGSAISAVPNGPRRVAGVRLPRDLPTLLQPRRKARVRLRHASNRTPRRPSPAKICRRSGSPICNPKR